MLLMLELAWRMWHEAKDAIHYRELAPFVKKLVAGKVIELGDEEVDDIAREMQAATFLKRDAAGNFSFVHRSFMQYFLARKIHDEIVRAYSVGAHRGAPLPVLNTRRLDRKIIFFLTLLDEADVMRAPLQQILITAYTPNVSENALQILYWSGRIHCGMEDEIGSHHTLQGELLTWIPRFSLFNGANLQEIVLEGADLADANLSSADLTKANLNHCRLARVNLNSAKLTFAMENFTWRASRIVIFPKRNSKPPVLPSRMSRIAKV